MTLIDQQDVLKACDAFIMANHDRERVMKHINALPTQEIIHCYECKHNPLKEWFGCPMAHLNERQRPEDAWCWKGEREAE